MIRVVALVAVSLLLVAIGYVGISHALMRAHVDDRGFGAALREALRELLWVILIQPLLPVYFFVGRRMGRSGRGPPVIFVHGYFQNRADFVYLARELRRHGIGPLFAINYVWLQSVEQCTRALGRFIDAVRRETGATQVDLVTHSLGGLLAVHYLAHEGGREHVRRCVTVATPHRGVAYRGPILGRVRHVVRRGHGVSPLPDVPFLGVYSTHDNVVFPADTAHAESPAAENVVVPGVGHLAILFAPETAQAVIRFLSKR